MWKKIQSHFQSFRRIFVDDIPKCIQSMFLLSDQFVLSELGGLELTQQSNNVSSAVVPRRSIPSFCSPVFQLHSNLWFQISLLTLKLQATFHEVLKFVVWYWCGFGERHRLIITSQCGSTMTVNWSGPFFTDSFSAWRGPHDRQPRKMIAYPTFQLNAFYTISPRCLNCRNSRTKPPEDVKFSLQTDLSWTIQICISVKGILIISILYKKPWVVTILSPISISQPCTRTMFRKFKTCLRQAY